MSSITSLFAKHWRNVHFLAIVLLSGLLIIKPNLVVPIVNQTSVSVFYSAFSAVKSYIADLSMVSEVNRQLRRDLAQTELAISMCVEAERENARLRSVLRFERPPGYELMPAEVISVSGDYFPLSAVINLGEDDSVYVDQPVINQQGLIGRIGSVSKDYATVQLLTDPSNRVAARVAASREMGIIKFSMSTGMVLDNFPIQGTIEVNDTILSSGLGGVYPAGLTVGFVRRVTRPELEPFCDIQVEPAANFYSLDELFVLKVEGQP